MPINPWDDGPDDAVQPPPTADQVALAEAQAALNPWDEAPAVEAPAPEEQLTTRQQVGKFVTETLPQKLTEKATDRLLLPLEVGGAVAGVAGAGALMIAGGFGGFIETTLGWLKGNEAEGVERGAALIGTAQEYAGTVLDYTMSEKAKEFLDVVATPFQLWSSANHSAHEWAQDKAGIPPEILAVSTAVVDFVPDLALGLGAAGGVRGVRAVKEANRIRKLGDAELRAQAQRWGIPWSGTPEKMKQALTAKVDEWLKRVKVADGTEAVRREIQHTAGKVHQEMQTLSSQALAEPLRYNTAALVRFPSVARDLVKAFDKNKQVNPHLGTHVEELNRLGKPPVAPDAPILKAGEPPTVPPKPELGPIGQRGMAAAEKERLANIERHNKELAKFEENMEKHRAAQRADKEAQAEFGRAREEHSVAMKEWEIRQSQELELWRQRLDKLGGKTPEEQLAINRLKTLYDESVQQKHVLDMANNNTNPWHSLGEVRNRYQKDFNAEKVVRIMAEDPTMDVAKVNNYIWNSTSTGFQKEAAGALKAMKNIVGENSPAWQSLQLEGYMRVMQDLTGKTPSVETFIARYDAMIERNLQASTELFGEVGIQELANLRKLAEGMNRASPPEQIIQNGAAFMARVTAGNTLAKSTARQNIVQKLYQRLAHPGWRRRRQMVRDLLGFESKGPFLFKTRAGAPGVIHQASEVQDESP